MPAYELTKANAAEIVPKTKNGTCVVLHHMDGCIHCEMFMPVWKQVCQAYKNKKAFVLISVEYSMTVMLPAKMQNVQGFPTLRAYKNGSPIAEFNESRTYDDVTRFIEHYGKSAPAIVASAEKKTADKPKPKPKASMEKKKTRKTA